MRSPPRNVPVQDEPESERTSREALRSRAEEKVRAAGLRLREPLSDGDTQFVLHELWVHQVELESQNEELRRTHAELEAARTRYFDLYDRAPVGYCALGADGVILEANLAAAEMCGTSRGTLVGKALTSFIHHDSQDTFYKHRRALVASTTDQRFELRLADADGAERWVLAEANLDASAGEPPRLRMTLSDISARKQAEAIARRASEELEQRVAERTADLLRSRQELEREVARRAESQVELVRSEGLLRAVLDTAPDAIVMTDVAGTVVLFNHAAEAMFGRASAEVLGTRADTLVHAAGAQGVANLLSRCLAEEGGPANIVRREVVGTRRDGTTFPIHLSLCDVQVDHLHLFTAILHDLSEHRRLEEQFRRAQKMEAVGRLASGIAHDFNNLLMGITGTCTVARRSAADQPVLLGLLDQIQGAAERGAGLSRQLLSFGRRLPEDLVPMQLNAVVQTTAALLRPMLGEDITLQIDLCPSGAPVLADSSGLEQILMNLAVNARDAMKHGGHLRISTDEVEFTQPQPTRPRVLPAGRYVRLVVEDTGCGIDPAIRERVFEPFYTSKPVGEGTGLGLYSVYGIVGQLGGAIDFDTGPGRGTRFTLLLPRSAEPAGEVDGAAPSAAAPDAPRTSAGARTILVVEDEPLIQFTLEFMLTAQGYQVLVASDYASAVRLVQEHAGDIDLLLTDVVLPGGYGNELATVLRAARRDLRVVFMSAFPADMLVRQGRIEPGTQTLEKPFDEDTLRQAIQRALAAPPPPP